MNIAEMTEQRYFIVLEALLMGFPIKYNQDWDIILNDGILYQTFYNKKNGKDVTHKSGITLQEFFNNFDKIPNEDLKRIYSNIRLHKLQRKLTAKE